MLKKSFLLQESVGNEQHRWVLWQASKSEMTEQLGILYSVTSGYVGTHTHTHSPACSQKEEKPHLPPKISGSKDLQKATRPFHLRWRFSIAELPPWVSHGRRLAQLGLVTKLKVWPEGAISGEELGRTTVHFHPSELLGRGSRQKLLLCLWADECNIEPFVLKGVWWTPARAHHLTDSIHVVELSKSWSYAQVQLGSRIHKDQGPVNSQSNKIIL